MKKYYLYLIGAIFILFSILVIDYIRISQAKIHSGTATITENTSIAKLDTEDKELLVNLKIFNHKDRVKVQYQKKWGKLYLTKIEAILDSEEAKMTLIQQIKEDKDLIKYQQAVLGSIYSSEAIDNMIYMYAMPELIGKQNYITVSPNEFLKYYYTSDCDCIAAIIPNDIQYTFKINKEFKKVVIKYLEDSFVKTLSYNLNENEFTFKPIEPTIYTVAVEFENGDIINYVFNVSASYPGL